LSLTHAPTGVLSVCPAATLPHVPLAHVLHPAVHASLQHLPSMQNPLAQSLAAAHAWAFAARQCPAPSHAAAGPTHAPSVWSAGTLVHVPSAPATLQATHSPAQAALQQYPSTQLADTHSVLPTQASPFVFLHAPAPSHALGAPQVPSVRPAAMFVVHVPLAFAQLLHAVVHASAQQVPSTQKPDAHCAAPVQLWPSASLHAPDPSHTFVPLHTAAGARSGCPAATFVVHAPVAFAQLLHGVVHAV
jgi:hypothetical protein